MVILASRDKYLYVKESAACYTKIGAPYCSPAASNSHSDGGQFIDVEHQPWGVTNQKHENVAHENGRQLVFHSTPFSIGIGFCLSVQRSIAPLQT